MPRRINQISTLTYQKYNVTFHFGIGPLAEKSLRLPYANYYWPKQQAKQYGCICRFLQMQSM